MLASCTGFDPPSYVYQLKNIVGKTLKPNRMVAISRHFLMVRMKHTKLRKTSNRKANRMTAFLRHFQKNGKKKKTKMMIKRLMRKIFILYVKLLLVPVLSFNACLELGNKIANSYISMPTLNIAREEH